MYVQCNNVACFCNHCRCGQVKSITYTECMLVALVIYRAKCTHWFILSPVGCLALPFFPHYLINSINSGKKVPNIELFWYFPQLLSEIFLILRRIRWYIITDAQRSYGQILMKCEFSWQIFKKILKYQISSGSQVAPCEWKDGQKDMMKLIVAFGNFLNAPRNETWYSQD